MGSEVSLLLQGSAFYSGESLGLTVANADVVELAPTLGLLQTLVQLEGAASQEAPVLSPSIDSFVVALESGDFSQARVLQTTIAREIARLSLDTCGRMSSRISLFGNLKSLAKKIVRPERKVRRRETAPAVYAGLALASTGSGEVVFRRPALRMSDPATRNTEAAELYRSGKVREAVRLWNKVLTETRSIQDRTLEAQVLLSRGRALKKLDCYRPAAQSFYEAGQVLLILERREEAAKAFALSWFLFEQGSAKPKALNAWKIAVDIAQTLSSDLEGEAYAYHLLGDVLKLVEGSQDKIEIYQKAGRAYQEAGCYGKAAAEYEREGDLLVLLKRTVEAAAAFDRAFLMLEGSGIHGTNLQRILQSREEALLKAPYSAPEIYARLAEIHHRQKERKLEARAHRSRGEIFRTRERYNLAAEEYLLAAGITRQMRDWKESADLQMEAAQLFFRGEFYLETARACRKAFKIYHERGQEKVADIALKMEAVAFKKAEHLDEAASLFAKVAARAKRRGNLKEASEAYLDQGLALRKLGRWKGAVKAFDQAADLFYELGNPRPLATAQAFQSEVLKRVGRNDEAEAVWRSALESLEGEGEVEADDFTLTIFMGNSLRDDDDLDEAIQMYEAALVLLEQQKPLSPLIGNLYETLGAILVQSSRAGDAIASFDKAYHHFVAIGERQSAGRVLESKKRLEEAN